MNIHTDQADLLQGLQYVIKAVAANHPIPILSGILITARPHELLLIASNAVTRIQYRIPLNSGGSQVGQTGSVVVPAKYFTELVRKLSPGPVTMESDETFLVTIRSGSTVCRLSGMNPSDYPLTPEDASAHPTLRLSNAALKRAIQQVAFAVSTSESRPVLTGVLCQVSGNKLRLLASDGVRLASGETAMELEWKTETDITPFIVPGKALSDFSRLIPDVQGTTRIVIRPHRITLQTAQLEVGMTLLHGIYPSIDQIIPSSCSSELIVPTANFLQAIERVTLMSGEGHPVKLDSTDANTFQLTSHTAEIGDLFEEVILDEKLGDEMSVCFNGKYMVDIVRSIGSDKVAIRFSGKWSPIVLQPADNADSLYLLTPIRTHS